MIVGIGIDVVEVRRLERALARTPGLAERLFTAAERGTDRQRSVRSLAGRFAAKEAAFKALSGRTNRWQEVEVVSADSGDPSLVLHGGAAVIARELGVTRIHVSITHDGALASAVAVLERA